MNLKEFADRLETLAYGSTRDEFFLGCVNDLSNRLLAKTVKRTPTGPGVFVLATDKQVKRGKNLYSSQQKTDKKGVAHWSIEKTGKRAPGVKLIKKARGGWLKQGWKSTEAKGGARRYSARVYNPVEYASYVEYGHRQHVGQFVPVLGKRLKRAWIPGQHMMGKSLAELNKQAGDILQRRLDAWLKGGLNK
nr:MAG TPA: putative tail component [Caudoviricetes sp.]